MTALFRRVGERTSMPITLTVDGVPLTAQQGDTLITALLTHQDQIGRHAFSGQPRAGFCLMGACQDCWVWLGDGQRVRACTTLADAGMDVLTTQPVSTDGVG